MNGRTRAAGATLAVLLALGAAGCGSDSPKGYSASAARGDAAAPQAMGGPAAKAGAPNAAPSAPALTPRSIAYSGQLSLLTGDVQKLLQRATDLAAAAGGYVSKENDTNYQDGPASAQLVLKVPAAQYQSSLDQLAALGAQVLSRSSQADDLSQQVVDVDSRVKSQQASVDRVRELMAKAQSLAEVVSLESELSRREADLESLKSQQQALGASTSLATITLDVRTQTPPPAPPAAPRKVGFAGSLGHALAGGWNVLFAILHGLLIALSAAAPFLLLLAPVGWYLLRRRRPKPAAAAEREEIQE